MHSRIRYSLTLLCCHVLLPWTSLPAIESVKAFKVTVPPVIDGKLDSRFDQQALYAFYVNPLGIQMDTRFAAGKEDPSIDLVWYSSGTIDNHGYYVEVRIPLKSLRFSTREPVSMGLLLERFISRSGTHVGYPDLDPAMGFNLFPQLMRVDYAGVRHYSLFSATV